MTLSAIILSAAAMTAEVPADVPPAAPAVMSVSQMPMADIVRPPQPKYPVQSVVSLDDVPVGEAARGIVGITLLVDQQGIARACEITRRSASPKLDFATCQLLKRRARFSPAIDRNGNPAMGRIAVEVDWGKVATMKGMRVN